jgi:hypothetical protein
MKKLFCITVIIMFCITGCGKIKMSKDTNILSAMVLGKQQKSFYEKTLGNPDLNENTKLVWNNYEMTQGLTGILSAVILNDNSDNTKSIVCEWDWTCVGTKDDYIKIYQYFTNEYGNPYVSNKYNTQAIFLPKKETITFQRSDSSGTHDVNIYQSISLYYDEGTNTINFMYPYPIDKDEKDTDIYLRK